MTLTQYYEKTVTILTVGGETIVGTIVEYFYPEDNESGIESVIVRNETGDEFELYSNDIDRISIV